MISRPSSDDLKPLHLQDQRDALIAQRTELAQQNTLRQRIAELSERVGAAVDDLDFEQRQKPLRLVVENVFVRGWRDETQLRIPLNEPPTPPNRRMSSTDRLRSLRRNERRELPPQPPPRADPPHGMIVTRSGAGNSGPATPSLRFRQPPPQAEPRPPRTTSPHGRGGSILLRPLVWFLSALENWSIPDLDARARSESVRRRRH